MTTVDRQADPERPAATTLEERDRAADESGEPTPTRAGRGGRWRARLGSVELLALVILAAILARAWLAELASPHVLEFVTVFASVVVAALPFLVFGAAVSAAVAAFVPARVLDRLRTMPALAAVPAGAVAGAALPPGEETAVESAAMVRRGLPVSVTLAFLLAAPAVSPVVLVATVVAFPDEPLMVLARLAAGLVVAIGMGLLWLWLGRPEWLAPSLARAATGTAGGAAGTSDAARDAGARPARGWPVFLARCRVDIVRAGGFLVAGAFVVAVLTAWLPPQWLDAIAGSGLFAVVFLALLAVLLSVQGGPDAFVAAALSQFSPTARLAFLVVGPVANLRLFTRLVSTFGPPFALRVGTAALVLGVAGAAAAGAVLL